MQEQGLPSYAEALNLLNSNDKERLVTADRSAALSVVEALPSEVRRIHLMHIFHNADRRFATPQMIGVHLFEDGSGPQFDEIGEKIEYGLYDGNDIPGDAIDGARSILIKGYEQLRKEYGNANSNSNSSED